VHQLMAGNGKPAENALISAYTAKTIYVRHYLKIFVIFRIFDW
jgi:hypothetical protein